MSFYFFCFFFFSSRRRHTIYIGDWSSDVCSSDLLVVEDSSFDRTMYAAVWLNVAAQLAAAQSARLMDAPFVFAQGLMVLGYTVALGGALLDNARLFERVRHMAVSAPLTGLAHYRRLLDVLQNDTEP